MKNPITERLKQVSQSRYALAAIIAIGLSSGLLTLFSNSQTSSTTEPNNSPSVDTWIPAGFVLVPIQIQNASALDSILGAYGLADLYQVDPEAKKQNHLVARALRIVRAPLDPKEFAVLVTDDLAPQIVRHTGYFNVVLRNPKNTDSNSASHHKERYKTKTPKAQILFEEIE